MSWSWRQRIKKEDARLQKAFHEVCIQAEKKTACSNGNSNNGSDEGGESRKRLAMLKDAVVAAKAELAVAKRFVIEKRQVPWEAGSLSFTEAYGNEDREGGCWKVSEDDDDEKEEEAREACVCWDEGWASHHQAPRPRG